MLVKLTYPYIINGDGSEYFEMVDKEEFDKIMKLREETKNLLKAYIDRQSEKLDAALAHE